MMNGINYEAYALSDDDFDRLEELLASDDLPLECMNVEVLDGYLAAILCSPLAISEDEWLPLVWSVDGDQPAGMASADFQETAKLVRRYHNEVLASIAYAPQWSPFCYGQTDMVDSPELGEDWIAGFEQGLDVWPKDWRAALPEAQIEDLCTRLESVFNPWEAACAGDLEQDFSSGEIWLNVAAERVQDLYAWLYEQGAVKPSFLE